MEAKDGEGYFGEVVGGGVVVLKSLHGSIPDLHNDIDHLHEAKFEGVS